MKFLQVSDRLRLSVCPKKTPSQAVDRQILLKHFLSDTVTGSQDLYLENQSARCRGNKSEIASEVKYTSIYIAHIRQQTSNALVRPLVIWDHTYLPPDNGDSHAITPAYCRYSFIHPGRMKSRVDLGGWLCQDTLPIDGHPSKY